jgi:hypothetical protein
MTGVLPGHARELRLAAARDGLSRSEAFERMVCSGDIREMVRKGLSDYDPDGEVLTMAIEERVKDALDGASRGTGVPVQSVGRMILAAHAGRMAEAVRDGAS